MREWMKRMVSLILAVATVGSILIGAVPPVQAAQPSQADALVNYAVAQDGKTGAEIGFGNEWCAYFVAWCASNAGLQNVFGTEVDSYTKFPYPKSHAAHMLKTGRGDLFYFRETYKSIDNAAIVSLQGDGVDCSAAQQVTRESFVPKKGDLICFLWKSSAAQYTWSHIGIVTGADDQKVYYVDGNTGEGDSYASRQVIANHSISRSSKEITCYIRPHYCTHSWNGLGVCKNTDCGAIFELTKNYTDLGTYKIKSTYGNVYSMPYKPSNRIYSIFGTNSVRTLYWVTNAKGEKWWYVRCGAKEGWMQDEQLKFEKALESQISFSNMGQPTTQKLGVDQPLQGVVKSNFFLQAVYAQVLDINSTVRQTTMAAFPDDMLAFSLHGSIVDQTLKLDKLPAGDYQLRVVVSDTQNTIRTWDSQFFTVQAPTVQTCGTPVITERGYDGGKTVTITSSTAGATIQYSYNGKSGSGLSPVSFNLTETATIRATASKAGMANSAATGTVGVYTCAKPTISTGRTTMDGLEISIAGQSGETLYYSVDGGNEQKYEKPFVITGSAVIRARAARSGYVRSAAAVSSIVFTAPDAPRVSLLGTARDIPMGGAITAQWEAVPFATHYIARLYRDGEPIEVCGTDTLLTDTAVTFAAAEAGSYMVEVIACNAVGESTPGYSAEVTAHAPLLVIFRNADGTALAKQYVRYGEDATAPEIPDKRGHTFSGWDRSLLRITENVTITATYEPNKYIIRFYDCNGRDLLGRQTVEFDQAIDSEAMAAKVTLKEGYGFVGWHITNADVDSLLDLEHIDSDMTLVATQQWEVGDLPIIISDVTAVRNAESTGYDVDMNITCAPASVIGGDTRKVKLIVSLKSRYEKMLAVSVETINLTEDVQDLSRSIFVSYNGSERVERADVVAVGIDGNDRTGGALSELASAIPTITICWSKWMTLEELKAHNVSLLSPDLVSKTQYRYTDATASVTTRTTASATPPEVEGYTYTGSTAAWGSWSAWSDTPITAGDDREVRTQQAIRTNAYTQYRYGRWTNGTNGHFCPAVGQSYYGGTWVPQYTLWSVIPLAKNTSTRYYCGNTSHSHINPDYMSGSTANWYSYRTGGTNYYWQETRNVPATYKTQYSYRDRVYTHSYVKWTVSNPSDWSDDVYTEYETETSRRTVETRTLYRYITNEDEVDNSHVIVAPRSCSGTLPHTGDGAELEGKLAAVLVYKETNSDPTEPQLEYVGQTTIGAGGSYKFNFLTKEEPSEATGDFVVTLALQGSSNVVNIDIVEADSTRYNVVFYDLDGKVLRRERIIVGRSATVPLAPVVEGYRFVCWDQDTTNIRSSMDINPIYVPEEYSVVFADFVNGTVSLESDYAHGDMLLTPDAPTAEGKVFAGWKVVSNATGEQLALLDSADAMETIAVTEDLIVTAMWTPRTHTVRFMDTDGAVLDSQTVEYGAAAQLPELTDLPEDMVFMGWSQDTCWWNVTADIDVYPMVCYAETTTAPVPNDELIINGVQDSIELTCAENASIYYTTDGSDPAPGAENTLLYTGAIECTESMTVRALAVEENKNASEIVEIFFCYTEGMEETPDSDMVEIGTYNVAAEAGKTVTLDFRIENNPGLAGYLFYVQADPDVFSVPCDPETDVGGYAAGTLCTDGTLLLGPYTEELGWQILWFGTEAAQGDGTLCSLTLQVSEEAATGVYPIRVGYSQANTFDSDLVTQPLPGLNIGISGSTEYKLGDVNNDGSITTADVVLMARSIVSLSTIPEERLFLADVNRDGALTLADVIYLARYIVGLEHLL